MQNWDIGRFLQQALPRELETLRLTRIVRLTSLNTHVWRSCMVPVRDFEDGPDAPPEPDAPREFAIDMLWELEKNPPSLVFWSVADVALPADTRPWLEQRVRRRNHEEKINLSVMEQKDKRLSLLATLHANIDPESVKEYMAPTPDRRVVERFAQSFEDASELLLQAWKDGVEIGTAYRSMH